MSEGYYESVGQFIYGFSRAQTEYSWLLAQIGGQALRWPETPDSYRTLAAAARARLAALQVEDAVLANFNALVDKFTLLATIEEQFLPSFDPAQVDAMQPHLDQLAAAKKMLAICKEDMTRLLASL
jgi:hypothetical protein